MDSKMLKRWKWTLFDLPTMNQTAKALTLKEDQGEVDHNYILIEVEVLRSLHPLKNLSIIQWFSRMNCKMLKRWEKTLFDLPSLKQTGKALTI